MVKGLPTRIATSLVLAFVGAHAACAPPPATIPLRPEPIAYADTLPIEPPSHRSANEVFRLISASVGGEIGNAFSLRRLLGKVHESLNVTRFDDVVSSAWFEHRITTGSMSPADVARGNTTTGPDTSATLTVIAGKAEGISPGFTVRDANGTRFLFKFDPKGFLHLASAAGVAANRLMYAAGYNVPEDFIVVFDRTRLKLSPAATIEEFGVERGMTIADVDTILSLTDSLADGRHLALASKFVQGKPLGPFHFSGKRLDDPNDYYHHEYRRELRGLYVISSWINHVDIRYQNTLDVYTEPPGYVRHYLIDFAASLGSGTIRPHNPREGKEYNFDFWPTMGRIFTLGFYQRGWEAVEFEPYHPAVGWLRAETFDPASWRPNWPNPAFRAVTPADGYWAAKIVYSFTDEQIRAAVDQGYLPPNGRISTRAQRDLGKTPKSVLINVLKIRRDKIVQHWFAMVVPIENMSAKLEGPDADRLVVEFDDLGIDGELWTPERLRYSWSLEDRYLGIQLAGGAEARSGRQRLEIDLASFDRDRDPVPPSQASAILRIHAERDGRRLDRAATATLRWEGPETGYRVVGLRH